MAIKEDLIPPLNIRRIEPDHLEGLADFFAKLVESGSNKTFHPHPFDQKTAKEIALRSNHTQDLYYVMDLGFDKVIGYGMLRGWDEGYDIPSLGIAIHPDYRGMKLALMFMDFLHTASRLRGSTKIMLSVYRHNTVAKTLYEKLGYKFTELRETELRGYYDL